ncbi:MAG TPA: rhodanese-like domain-containing protein [Bellilinea sp.]|nr:rhodanese-like domain-containing protein [Bellilinea sp.]
MKKLSTILAVLLVLSFVLTACQPAAPVAAPTTAPAPVEPTKAPEEPAPTAAPVAVAIDYQALWKQIVSEIPKDKGYGTVGAAKLNEEFAEKAPFLLDIRTPGEVEKGYIKGAVNIPVNDLLNNLDKLPAQDQPIVIYCGSGHRGGFALAALKLLGYTNVRNLAGGVGAWTKAELPLETAAIAAPTAGTAPEIKDKQLFDELNAFFTNLPENFYSIGADALNADLADGKKYTLVDIRREDEFASGYLAGAINLPLETIFDNLDKLPAKDQPIIIYCVSGHRGAVAAMGLRLLGYEYVLNLGGGINAWKAKGFALEGAATDWTVAWTDYFKAMPDSMYAIGAADLNAKLADKPPFLLDVREESELTDPEKGGFITGAVHIPMRTLLDNLDKLPAQDQPIVIYCASGHRGAIALAALQQLGWKDVLNLGGGIGAWKKAELPLEPAGVPAAPAAGTAPAVDAAKLEGMKAFWATMKDGFHTVSAADLSTQLLEANKPVVVDLREPAEIAKTGVIEGAKLIPVRDLMSKLGELPAKDAPIVLTCASGHRGGIALLALYTLGYTNVRNLAGGMNAWIGAELPVVQPVAQ